MVSAEQDSNRGSNSFYEPLLRRRAEIEGRYRSLTPTSQQMFEAAAAVLPGGSTRDSVLRSPYPTFIEKAEATSLIDVDGRRITDFWFNATALPLGHCHPSVVEAATAQVARGSAFFGPGRPEIALAREILERLPAADKIRFTNSGSEAVMMAIRIARGATGRAIVAKFEGSYHGSYDDVSWSVGPNADQAGSPDRPNAVAESGGLPTGADRILVLPYNDLPATTELIEQHAAQIAALIVEPVANRMGFVMPSRDFIQGLRTLCDRHAIVLIFDEVIAFRIGFNGAQGTLGVRPDLTALGKVIGGGFPVGAVAVRADIMVVSEPGRASRVTHTGTFNANPVTMVAGLAVLNELQPAAFDQINGLGEHTRVSLRQVFADLPVQIDGEGSLFKISAIDAKVTDYRTSLSAHRGWEETLSLALLAEGFFLTTRLQGCISTATTADEIDGLIAAISRLTRH